MKLVGLSIFLLLVMLGIVFWNQSLRTQSQEVLSLDMKPSHWFMLNRKSNVEFLYFGVPGKKERSKLVKTFTVKTGVPFEKPTPLPHLLNREYWIITDKFESHDNPETAPYFLELDIPISENPPFGPVPYLECNGPASPGSTSPGGQCDWVLPGTFGLHGVNGDKTRLSQKNPGSSGCIRHFDTDITYLYNLLDPQKEEIRYYIADI